MKEIKLHPPSAFEPLLTDNVLMYFAIPMLDIYHDVHMLLNSINDNNYTRGTAIFGRTYEQFKKLIVSDDCPVEFILKMAHSNLFSKLDMHKLVSAKVILLIQSL